MTREEAIEKLKRERNGVCRGCVHPSMVGWCENHCKLPEAYDVAIEALGQPEIIRCKDCENWDTTWQNDSAPNYHYCPIMDGTYSGDFYCGKAERSTDEQPD